jgi:hypothetical protein
MIEHYSVSVPCKTYVRKYFCTLYGDTIQLNQQSDTFDTILTKMVTKPLQRLNHHKLNQAFLFYNNQIKFQLPIDYFHRLDKDLDRQQIFSINRFLENVFESDLFTIVNIGAAFGIERRTAIESFARNYNIILEEDITYEALKQSEYRLRKSPTMKENFLVTLSSPFSAKRRA